MADRSGERELLHQECVNTKCATRTCERTNAVRTGWAELETTTAGAVASVLDSHVRSLPEQTSGQEPPVVRGWTLTGGSAADTLRIETEVRRVLPDSSELVDDAESYAQLQGLAAALRATGFVVDGVLEGWRTVAVEVRAAPGEPVAAPKQEKAKKAKKVKAPKAAKANKVDAPGSGSDSGTDSAGASAPDQPAADRAPNKPRGGLLRRRSAEPAPAPADEPDKALEPAG
jgi:hypothetical protein